VFILQARRHILNFKFNTNSISSWNKLFITYTKHFNLPKFRKIYSLHSNINLSYSLVMMWWYSTEVSCEYLFASTLSAWIRRALFNPLNAELNPICYLLALLGAHRIFHVSGLRINPKLPDFLVFPYSKSRFKSNTISVLPMICW